MLSEFNVRSYGLINSLNWQLEKGLNVITGETGAGKSMVLSAFEALLDGRITDNEIRYNDDSCKIEAFIDLDESEIKDDVRKLLEDKGLNAEEDTLLLSCDIKRHGHSVSRINGDITQRGALKDLRELLVDIHGQSQHLSLYDKRNHLGYLDDYGSLSADKQSVSEKYHAMNEIRTKIEELKSLSRSAANNRDLLTFQVEEIRSANLDEDEETSLRERKDILANAEKIKGYVYEIGEYLTESEGGSAESTLGRAAKALRKISSFDSSLEGLADQLESITEDVTSIAYKVSDYGDSLEFDPRELESIEERLTIIKNIKKKYGPEIKDALAYLEEAEAKLSALDNAEYDLTNLEEDLKRAEKEYLDCAETLSDKRKKTAEKMNKAVMKELKDLDMPNTVFSVDIKRSGGQSENGIDDVEFMVSTIPGEPMKPLAEIASTGEVSRFTLAIKSALASSDKVPILIFDEIDIGVGGRTGDVLGKKLWELSRHHQVICVTHLAQIACYADAHYSVSKAFSDERLTSHMVRLDDEERMQELALMVGGQGTKDSALEVAKQLISAADSWKKTN